MIYILIISLLVEKSFYLLRRQSFSFQRVSETVYKYIFEIFSCFVPEIGLLTPYFIEGREFSYPMIVSGGGLLPPSSRAPGGCPGWVS